MLASNCFYSSGIESGSEDDVMSCINMNFDEQNFDYFCFYCQINIIDSFSDELHYIALSLLLLVKREKMKFRVCCCLFDYYVYKLFHTIVISIEVKI